MSTIMFLPEKPYFGEVHYFEAKRCFNTEKIRGWNQNKITAEELVSFDCGLFNLYEIETPERYFEKDTQQIMAVIIRPGMNPSIQLNREGFTFCGYDLVEDFSCISAITDCGGTFQSIDYAALNEFGLLKSYKEAVLTQLALVEEDPDEPHACCNIVEIWRKIVK